MSADRLINFGRPSSFAEAVLRIPDRTHPDYQISGGPHEHCAHLREFLIEKILFLSMLNEGVTVPLATRSIPLNPDDISLLSVSNSFRIGEPVYLTRWSMLKNTNDNPWIEFLPSEDDGFHFWKISKMDPKILFSGYELYSIETHPRFDLSMDYRLNLESDFEIVLAKEEEIKLLVDDLSRYKG